jgi:NAD(P)H-flavin reductase/ferredoxin
MAKSQTEIKTHKIRLEPSGKSFLAKEGQTLLDAAIRNEVQIPYGCRHGNCAACKALVLEGDFELMGRISEYSLLSFERDEGYVLLCSTLAESDMVLEVEEETDVEFFPIHDFEADIVGNCQVTDDIHVINMRLKNPENIRYAAGQFFEFDIPALGETRAYSMANSHQEGADIEFHVKRIQGGRGSNYLCDLKTGERVTGSGPYGKMQLRDRDKDLLFVAGGSGMAPIKALLEELFSQPFAHKVWFFYGARTKRDLYLMDEWTKIENDFPNFHFIPALSEHDPEDEWNGEVGYIADVVEKHITNGKNMDAFLCGPPILIETTIRVLSSLGLKHSNIFYDEF